MVEGTIEALAARAWDRASTDAAFLTAEFALWLVDVIGADGTERRSVYPHSPGDRLGRGVDVDERLAELERAVNDTNVGKRLSKRIAGLDASAAAIAWMPWRAFGHRSQWNVLRWLAVVAADEVSEVAYLASVEPAEDGPVSIGDRSLWLPQRPKPFERDLTHELAPQRDWIIRVIRQGLTGAAQERGRSVRRSRDD